MITLKDLLMGRIEYKDLPPDQQRNAMTVIERINRFFEDYKGSLKLKVNDGYRRAIDAPKNGAAQSKHYLCAAIDIDDDDAGTVWQYVWANRKRLKDIGLWLESPNWTHCDGMSWLHFQVVPPNSGRRFYVPSMRPNPNPKFWDSKYEAALDGFAQPA